MTQVEDKNLFKHRVKLLALIGIFLLPFIASWLAFYVFEYRPGSKNYGALVQPVKPLQMPELTDRDNNTLAPTFWNKWTFVLLDKQGCDQLCKDNLYYLRQMKTALGRDMDRVQNVLITSVPLSTELTRFLSDYPQVKVIISSDETVFRQFELPDLDPGAASVLYLVDPRQNLMMTYPAVNDPSSILSDMRRLMKVSQIG